MANNSWPWQKHETNKIKKHCRAMAKPRFDVCECRLNQPRTWIPFWILLPRLKGLELKTGPVVLQWWPKVKMIAMTDCKSELKCDSKPKTSKSKPQMFHQVLCSWLTDGVHQVQCLLTLAVQSGSSPVEALRKHRQSNRVLCRQWRRWTWHVTSSKMCGHFFALL